MKKTRTNLVLVLLVATIFFGLANAGPDAPPHSIIAALQGIQEALLALSEPEQKNDVDTEGYCEYFETVEGSNQIAFIVPLEREFVLRKLYIAHRAGYLNTKWQLMVDDNIFVDGSIMYVGTGGENISGVHNFPDGCLVINAGETLKIINKIFDEGFFLKTTIIGYFRDI